MGTRAEAAVPNDLVHASAAATVIALAAARLIGLILRPAALGFTLHARVTAMAVLASGLIVGSPDDRGGANDRRCLPHLHAHADRWLERVRHRVFGFSAEIEPSTSTRCRASASTIYATPTPPCSSPPAFPIKVVSEQLGHAHPAFTMHNYQHLLPGMSAAAAEQFAALIAS